MLSLVAFCLHQGDVNLKLLGGNFDVAGYAANLHTLLEYGLSTHEVRVLVPDRDW